MTHEDEALDHENEALDHELGTQYDDLTEPERYETATDDWQSPEERKFKKQLADYRKNHPEEFCRESMLTTKPARRWQQSRDERNKPKTELFGPMWRTGELAVLFGEPGAGKSILAVQIAEAIARGKAMTAGPPKSSPPYEGGVAAFRGRGGSLTPHNVLYLDFEHSAVQFDERYSCPSPIPGKLPVKYNFSTKLHRAGFGNLEIPVAFQGNHSRYFIHSLNLALEETGANVIIIDDLSWFDTSASGAASAARTLRDLKFFCLKTGASVLVLHSSPAQTFRIPRAPRLPEEGWPKAGVVGARNQGLRIPRTAHRIYEPADSVFAIAHSRFFPEMRYVKNLRSAAPPVGTGSGSDWVPLLDGQVLTYAIQRTAGPKGSPPYEGGVDGASADGVVLSKNFPASSNSSLTTPHSPLTAATPFLGLTYVGLSAESDHYRDFEREFQNAKRVQTRRALRSSKEILVDGIIDGSYDRYLKGE